jgi:hypothetical protein
MMTFLRFALSSVIVLHEACGFIIGIVLNKIEVS